MTLTSSLFACSAPDVTVDRVRALVDQAQPESLTVEYKEKYTPSLVKSVVAMANSYGGLVLVGVTDGTQGDRVIGVANTAITQVANGCHEGLEPPWEPEIIPVSLPGKQDLFVLVIRVDPARAPRPIFHEGRVPIRLHGRNATADRDRVAQLFAESAQFTARSRGDIPRPYLPTTAEGDGRSTADFVLRSGVRLPVDGAASWRPLSERGVTTLARILNNRSPIDQALLRWCGELGIQGIDQFRRHGFNRARAARLVWEAVANEHRPIEVTAEVRLPTAYGATDSHLLFTLDVVGRLRDLITAKAPAVLPEWRLSVPVLHMLVDGLIATLVDRDVMAAVAGLAGIDPLVVPQPCSLDLLTGPPVKDLLNLMGLVHIPNAGTSSGANLVADPSLDLSDPVERQEQVDNFLVQIGLDAGLTGMEALLARYHHEARTVKDSWA